MVDVHRRPGLLVGEADAGRIEEFAVAGDRDREAGHALALGCFRQLRLQRVQVLGAERALPDRVESRLAARGEGLNVEGLPALEAVDVELRPIVGNGIAVVRDPGRAIAALLPDRRIVIDAAGTVSAYFLKAEALLGEIVERLADIEGP